MTSSSPPNSRRHRTVKDTIIQFSSSALDYFLVNFAIQLKKSSLPRALALSADYSLETIDKLDTAFELREKSVWIAGNIAEWCVIGATIFGRSALKAGIAYQQTMDTWQELNVPTRFPGSFVPPILEAKSTQTEFEKENVLIPWRKLIRLPVTIPMNIIQTSFGPAKSADVHNHSLWNPSFNIVLKSLIPDTVTNFFASDRIKGDYIVHLSVGGKVFSTKISTLTCLNTSGISAYFLQFTTLRVVNRESSIDSLFEHKGSNEFYVDRDGVLFYYILEYLRYVKQGGHPSVPPRFLKTCFHDYDYHGLSTEAKYYGIHSLIECIESCITESEFKQYGVIYEMWMATFDVLNHILLKYEPHLNDQVTSYHTKLSQWKEDATLFIIFAYSIYLSILYFSFTVAFS